MIREEGRYLHWIHYGTPVFSLNTIYLSCLDQANPWFMYRRQKQHLWIDLKAPRKELFDGLTGNTRNEIRQFEDRTKKVVRDDSVVELSELFELTREAKSLGSNQYERLNRKPPNRLCSRVYDDELGLLAAHLYLPDEDQKIAYLDCNASAFRAREDTNFRQICGQANRYLFWSDFIYFRDLNFITIDLGGYKQPKDAPDNLKGVYTFKQSFGGRVQILYDFYPLWYHYFRVVKSFCK